MTAPAVTVTYVANTVLTASNLNTNFSDLVTYLSNRNDGTSTWDRLLVTSSSAVPLIVNNSTGTTNIANFQDNGTNVFQIVDGGDVYMNATKKLYLDGGSNTYIDEVSADVIEFVGGGGNIGSIGIFSGNTQFKGRDGIAAAPYWSFATAATSGFYKSNTDQISMAIAGAEVFRFAATTASIIFSATTAFQVDTTASAGSTRVLIYDVDNATLERVTVGIADSGGVGFKLLRIPN